jgi:hypothetical protein
VAETDEAIEKIKAMIVSDTLRTGDRLPKPLSLVNILDVRQDLAAAQASPLHHATPARHAAPSGNVYSSTDRDHICVDAPATVGAMYLPSLTTAGLTKCSCR